MAGEDLNDKPTFNDMLNWRDTLCGEWGELDDEMEGEEGLYFQRFKVDAPNGKYAVKTGSAPADADAAIDSLIPPELSISVKPARAKEKYRKQAEKLVYFGTGMLHVWRKRRDFLRWIAADMTIRRVGVCRIMKDDRLWPSMPPELMPGEEPKQEPDETLGAFQTRYTGWQEQQDSAEDWEVKHRRKVPIIAQWRNPRYVRWRDIDGELIVVVEHYQTTVLEAKVTYGMHPATTIILAGREPDEIVFVDDVWYGKYRCLILEDQPLFPVGGTGEYAGVSPHGYGEIPYVVMPFRELPFEEYNLRYRGLLTNAASLYPVESAVLSMHVFMLAVNAWRTYLGWTKDGRQIEMVPGQYIPIDERIGEYLKILEGQPVPPELFDTASVMDSYIDRNGVSQGPRTSQGTRSGQQLWAIQAMRQLKMESAKDSLSRGIGRMLGLAARIVEENLAEKVTIPVPGVNRDGEDMGEVVIGPRDINGYWDGFVVSLGRRIDPALLEQAKSLNALEANKFMPKRAAIEMSGLTDNPQEWMDELVREAVDALPFVLEQVGLERVKTWFGEDSERFIALSKKLMEQQQAQKSPAAPQGGTMQSPALKQGANQGQDAGAMLAQGMKGRAGKGAGKSGNTNKANAGQKNLGQ